MSTMMENMHPYTAHRFVKLFEMVSKKYGRVLKRTEAIIKALHPVPSADMDEVLSPRVIDNLSPDPTQNGNISREEILSELVYLLKWLKIGSPNFIFNKKGNGYDDRGIIFAYRIRDHQFLFDKRLEKESTTLLCPVAREGALPSSLQQSSLQTPRTKY